MQHSFAFVALAGWAVTISLAQTVDPAIGIRSSGCHDAPGREPSPLMIWCKPGTDSFQLHVTLRTAAKMPVPSAKTMITLFGQGGHHVTTAFSIIVTRDERGKWTGSAVSRSQSWARLGDVSVSPETRWTLSDLAGRRLDRLASSQTLVTAHGGSPSPDQGISLGALDYTFSARSRYRRVDTVWQGAAPNPLLAELEALIRPPRS